MEIRFEISYDKERMDIDVIHKYLCRSYWAQGIDIETIKTAIENSLCFGAFLENGSQIGFARLITDYSTFAYLADVFVLEEYRGLGVSKAIMATISKHEIFEKLRRIMLATRDAHGLYKQFGFQPINKEQNSKLMQIIRPNIYNS